MKFQVLLLVCVSLMCSEAHARWGRRYYQPQQNAVAEPAVNEPTPAVNKPEAKPEEAVKEDELHPVESQMLETVNAARVARGLSPFVLDPQIQKTCRWWCAWMANNRSMVHSRMNLAENIACGQQSAHHVLGSWLGSSGHFANIMNWGHRRIGVAAYEGADGRIYWCQQFAP